VRVLDCVTHALNCIREPDPTRITPADIGRDLSPALVLEIVSFLDAHASPSRAPQGPDRPVTPGERPIPAAPLGAPPPGPVQTGSARGGDRPPG
jgi:hypothetical protein